MCLIYSLVNLGLGLARYVVKYVLGVDWCRLPIGGGMTYIRVVVGDYSRLGGLERGLCYEIYGWNYHGK